MNTSMFTASSTTWLGKRKRTARLALCVYLPTYWCQENIQIHCDLSMNYDILVKGFSDIIGFGVRKTMILSYFLNNINLH